EQVCKATEFLCRDCSCQVKELNPGVDLLIAADWNHIFDEMFKVAEAPPAPIDMLTSASKSLETPVSVPPAVAPEPEKTPTPTPVYSAQTWQSAAVSEGDAEIPCCSLDMRLLLWIATGIAGVLVI